MRGLKVVAGGKCYPCTIVADNTGGGSMKVLTGWLLLLALAAPLQAAKVYKWVDADGRVHYESTPPPVDDYQTLDIREPPPVTPPHQPEPADAPAQPEPEVDEARPDPAELARKRREIMRYNCAAARKNKQVLLSFRRVEVPDGQGGKRLLTGDERQEKLQQAEQQIRKYCRDN